MVELDRRDIALLRSMYYDQGPTFDEVVAHIPADWGDWLQLRRRLYRLSRHGLCGAIYHGEGEFPCWGLGPDGDRVIEETSTENWESPNYRYQYHKAEPQPA